MKKLSLILTFLFISTITYGQTTFNNGDGDNKWSTAANWTNGIPNAANAKAKIAAASVIVDGDYTVGQIIFVNAAAGGQKVITFTNANNGTLTITGKGVSQPVQLNRNPQHAIFNLPVIFDSSENKTETWRFNSGNEKITFGEGHSLTVNDEMVFTAKTNTSSIIFNGTNKGVGNLKFGTASNVKFGSTYDGSSYSGTMIIAGDNTTAAKVTLTSDVADAGTFLKSGASISVVKNGGTINVNGKNTLKGDISVTAAFKVALNINKNQSAIGTITIGSGTLNLALATDVTSAAFADNSSADWGTGSLVITGAGDQEVSFGTTADGITADQLAQITLNGSTPLINSTGKLIGSSIKVSTFNNAGGDNLWSNAANWSVGIPNDDTAKVTVNSDLIVDSSVTVGQIKMSGATSDASVTITATNSSVLTITGAGVTQPIQNNKSASSFIFNLPVVFDSEGGTETLKLNSGGDQQITFSSSLTLNDPLTVTGVNKLHDLNLNGSLLGAGNLILGAKAQANFGASYDGSSHTGDIVVTGTGTNNDNLITSNVSDEGTLLASGNQIDVQGAGAKIIVNGANTLKGNIKIGDNDPTLTINKNQSALGTITMGAGTLNLVFATDVTSAAFADNSSADWGTGSLVITGAADNEVSFGTTADGVTAAQLAQITMSGSQVKISDTGKISVLLVAVSTFNNAGGDNLWSNAANWSAGIPNVDTAKVTVDSDLIVDSSVTVAQIKMSGATSDDSVTITATNSSVLTVTGAGVTQPIQNNKKASSFIFNLPVVFDSSEDKTETIRLNSGGDQQITFSSSLTLNDPLTVSGVNKLHDLNLKGALLGAGNLKFGNKVQANFGASYDGSAHTGEIIVAGTGTNNDNLITSNVSDEGTLLASGNQIDVQGAGAKIIVNGANTLKGNIKIGDNDPTLTINKNQSALGTITMGGGTLNLVLATDVTSVAFADNSSADWGTGSLVITGAADNEVSFGTTAAGITADQLAQITMDVYSAPNILISSSGQISVKADIDEDGILNNEDECPDTPKGTVVNYKGCPTFVLPENNNKVEITSATCIGYSDGSIGLSVVDTSYDYTITITGNTDVLLTGSNNKASVTGLAKGTYTVCFKVDGEPEYEQCFDVLIEEPERISVYMDVDIDNKTSSFQLSGSNIYNIDVNGTLHKVNKDSFTTSLPAGLSIIKIYTDLDCQGIIEKEVFISEDIMYYPNPTINDVNVHISGMDKKVMISVFSEKGDLVLRKEQQVQDLSRLTEIDLSLQNTGTYIVVMEGKTVRKTFKIIKK